jgi:glycosyltransferase involved in cell wall biosynthesis
MSKRHLPRILFVTHAYLPDSCAGVEGYTQRLASALAERGHDVGLLCARVRPGLAQNSVIEESVDGISVWGIVQNYPYRDLPEALNDPAVDRVARTVMQSFAPDLLSVQSLAGLSLGILAVAADLGIPRVLHLHDAWWSCPSGGQRRRPCGSLCAPVDRSLCAACFDTFRHREGPLEKAGRWLAGRLPGAIPADAVHRSFAALPEGAQHSLKKLNERAAGWSSSRSSVPEPAASPGPELDPRIAARHRAISAALRTVDRVLSPSAFLLESLRSDGLDFPRADLVPTGVPLGSPPLPRSSAGPLKVLYVGTWVEHKGPHVLAKALAGSSGDSPPTIIARAAGPAPFPAYRDDALALAEGRITPLGTLASAAVREQMDWADVVVVPSLWAENAPLVALEARAAGRPVIASNIGGLPELVEDGTDGLLFPPGDADALAALLQQSAKIRGLEVRPPRSLTHFVDEVQTHYTEVSA